MSTRFTIPKNKWVVVAHAGSKIISRHFYKSAAMDKALTTAHRTGKRYAVCEIGYDGRGDRVLFEMWATPKGY